jgi:hypothetical protein
MTLDLQVKPDGLLEEFIFPHSDPGNPHYLLVNFHQIVQNTLQIFDINQQGPSDLEPAYIIGSARESSKHLVIVRG